MYRRSIKPKEILGAFKEKRGSDEVYVRVKYAGKTGVKLVRLKEVKEAYPQLLIQFYEKHISWINTSPHMPQLEQQIIDVDADTVEEEDDDDFHVEVVDATLPELILVQQEKEANGVWKDKDYPEMNSEEDIDLLGASIDEIDPMGEEAMQSEKASQEKVGEASSQEIIEC